MAAPLAAVDVAVGVRAPHAAVELGVKELAGVVDGAVEGVVAPDALEGGARRGRQRARPVPFPVEKVALVDVAVGVVQPPHAAAQPRRKLARVPLAVGLDHHAVPLGHAAARLRLRRAHVPLVPAAVGEALRDAPNQRAALPAALPHVAVGEAQAAGAVPRAALPAARVLGAVAVALRADAVRHAALPRALVRAAAALPAQPVPAEALLLVEAADVRVAALAARRRQLALPDAQPAQPLPLVPPAVGARRRALARAPPVVPLAVVPRAVGLDQDAVALAHVVVPAALVPAAVGAAHLDARRAVQLARDPHARPLAAAVASHRALAVPQPAAELALVHGAPRVECALLFRRRVLVPPLARRLRVAQLADVHVAARAAQRAVPLGLAAAPHRLDDAAVGGRERAGALGQQAAGLQLALEALAVGPPPRPAAAQLAIEESAALDDAAVVEPQQAAAALPTRLELALKRRLVAARAAQLAAAVPLVGEELPPVHLAAGARLLAIALAHAAVPLARVPASALGLHLRTDAVPRAVRPAARVHGDALGPLLAQLALAAPLAALPLAVPPAAVGQHDEAAPVPHARLELAGVALARAWHLLLAVAVQHGGRAALEAASHQPELHGRHELAAQHRAARAVAPLAAAVRQTLHPAAGVHDVGRRVEHRSLAVRHVRLELALVCAVWVSGVVRRARRRGAACGLLAQARRA